MKNIYPLILSVSCFLFALFLTMIWIREREENLATQISPEILRFMCWQTATAKKIRN